MIERILAALERQGGHVLVGIAFVAAGALLQSLGVESGRELLGFGSGITARSMWGERDEARHRGDR